MIQKTLKKNYFEVKAWKDNFYVCGIDEVGRGCLAGPLVVSAAILPLNTSNPLLKDSKKLSETARNQAYTWLKKHCWHSSAFISNYTIDKKNIYQATLYGMKKALMQLTHTNKLPIKYVLIDAMPLNKEGIGDLKAQFHHFNYGETYSNSIAAASIIAKVTRDNLLKKLDSFYPLFKLGKHKGYATQIHRNSLVDNGPSIIHRTTFISNIPIMQGSLHETCKQQTLF